MNLFLFLLRILNLMKTCAEALLLVLNFFWSILIILVARLVTLLLKLFCCINQFCSQFTNISTFDIEYHFVGLEFGVALEGLARLSQFLVFLYLLAQFKARLVRNGSASVILLSLFSNEGLTHFVYAWRGFLCLNGHVDLNSFLFVGGPVGCLRGEEVVGRVQDELRGLGVDDL